MRGSPQIRRTGPAIWRGPALAACLLAGGLLLAATAVPGPFSIDEDHYMVTVLGLREGRLTVPGTANLTPTRELLYFDPMGHARRVEEAPVAATAPPLYALIALPFSYLGWRGLILLNALAFLGTVLLVFCYTARYARSPAAPWIAASAFGLGGYGLEYAQGVWPHMLAVFLCTAALALAARARDGSGLLVAGAAGLLAGLAAGVRYQNAIAAAGLGLGVLFFAPRTLAAGAAYGAGAAVPLLASAAVNAVRLGSWNPISKGPRYLSGMTRVGEDGSRVLDIPHVLWAKVVDFGQHPLSPGAMNAVESVWREPVSGAIVMYEGAKKAWLQSSPWVAVGIVALAAAWLWWARDHQHWLSQRRTKRRGGGSRDADGESEAAQTRSCGWSARTATQGRRELQAMAMVVFPVLFVFGWAGFDRHDGLCFNQRYFHELVPLAAVALAFAMDGRVLSRVAALLAALVAVGAAGGLLLAYPNMRLTYLVLMDVPLALAFALLATWLLPDGRASGVALSAALGLCIGWGFAVHVGDDIVESRKLRWSSKLQREAVARALPEGRSALFAYSGVKVAHGPLQMERDLVILDPALDGGKHAPRMVDELLDRDRRVFVIATALPRPIFDAMVRDHSVLGGVHLNVGEGLLPLTVYELGRPGEERDAFAASDGDLAPARKPSASRSAGTADSDPRSTGL